MKILDRYLLRTFLTWFGITIVGLTLVFIVINLTEKVDTFIDYKTPVGTVVRYYAYSVTNILTQILPLCLLLAAVLSLGQLKKHNELTAMQACGQSPWRLSRSLLIAAFIIAAGQYYLNEEFAAEHYAESKRILTEEVKKLSEEDRLSKTNVRLLGGGSRLWVAQFYDAKKKALRNVSVQVVTSPDLSRRWDADRAQYRGEGVWEFERGYYRSFGDQGESSIGFSRYGTSRIGEIPDDFARRKVDPFRAGMAELYRFAQRVKESGGETQRYMTNFHLRASYPISGLIMVLLGAGLSLRVIRGGNMVLGVGISLAAGFVYFALIRVGQALGYNGTLPPAAAAWLGNAVFLFIGALLFRRVAR